MKKLVTLVLVFIAVIGILFAGGSSESSADGVLKLKMGTTGATTGVLYKAAMDYAAKVAEVSSGKISIEVIGSGALGTTAQHYAQLREGSLDIFITALDTGTTLKGGDDFAVCVMPYLFRDSQHYSDFVESEVLHEMMAKVESENGIKYLGPMGNDFARCLSARFPVHSIADVNNLKVRVPETKSMMMVWEAWGANPMIIASKETYTALQSGMCDAQENSLQTAFNNGWLEVAPYFMPIEYVQQGNILYMSTITYDKLTDQQKAWLEEGRASAHVEFNKWMQDSYASLVETAKEEGVIFVDDVDIEGFKTKAIEVAKELDGVMWTKGLYDKIAAIGM